MYVLQILGVTSYFIGMVYICSRVAGAGWHAAKLDYNAQYFNLVMSSKGETQNEAG